MSTNIGIATAATNQNTRHPMVTAAYATTMHFLTGGRFALGLGRGIDMMFDAFGLPHITTAQIEDFAGLMRRLWRGETVVGHKGPAGSWPVLRLDPAFREDIPLMLTAFGPNSLALGGRAFDGVVLHTFFTDETTQRCVRTIKQAAGRSRARPGGGARVVVFCDDRRSSAVSGAAQEDRWRMATYLQAYGDLMVRTNRWDPAVLQRFRADPLVAKFQGAIDQRATTEELEQVAELIPEAWLAPAATGSPQQCVASIQRQFDLGCDGVILHGASPDDLAPIVEAYRAARPTGRFDHLPANPAAAPRR